MIICVSANPAIDRRLRVERWAIGQVNRAHTAVSAVGGKAAHVAMAARALGEEVSWVGFLGGSIGDEIEHGLSGLGIEVVPVRTKSATRINLEVVDAAGLITEVLEPGGTVEPEDVNELIDACDRLLEHSAPNTQIVLSGSLPPGAPVSLYARLIRRAHVSGRKALLDTSRDALSVALAASPDLVKPNHEEATWALGRAVSDVTAATEAARQLIVRGARTAAVSLGLDGLVWLRGKDDAPLIAAPPAVAVRSTVGCGDATVAGFAVAAARGLNAEETLRLATACGAANCLASLPGQIRASEVERIAPLVTLHAGNTVEA